MCSLDALEAIENEDAPPDVILSLHQLTPRASSRPGTSIGGDDIVSVRSDAVSSVLSYLRKLCLGCGLSHEDTQWMSQTGEGSWCYGCHGAWRTLYSRYHTLTNFGQGIKDKPARIQWRLEQVAFRSLKVEDPQKKITVAQITERANAFKFAFAAFGFPLEESVVVLLEDLQSGTTRTVTPNREDLIRHLTTVRLGGHDRIVAFVPVEGNPESHVFARPRFPDSGFVQQSFPG